MVRYGIVAAVLILISSSAEGTEEFSAKRLYGICQHHDPDSTEHIVCVSYVRGLIEGMLFGSVTAGTTVGYCPPENGISLEEGRRVIEKYMHDNPRHLHEKASVIAGTALLSAFPCKTAN
jgi:Rap1a immunity proteins